MNKDDKLITDWAERVAGVLNHNPDASLQNLGKEIITFTTKVVDEFTRVRQELADLKTRMYREISLYGRITENILNDNEKEEGVDHVDGSG